MSVLTGSLAEARELYDLLGQIQSRLGEINGTMGAGTTKEAESHAISFQFSMWELYITARRVKRILSEMGLPPEVEGTVALLTRMTLILNSIYRLMQLIKTAEGPFGWFQVAVALAYTATLASDLDRVSR